MHLSSCVWVCAHHPACAQCRSRDTPASCLREGAVVHTENRGGRGPRLGSSHATHAPAPPHAHGTPPSPGKRGVEGVSGSRLNQAETLSTLSHPRNSLLPAVQGHPGRALGFHCGQLCPPILPVHFFPLPLSLSGILLGTKLLSLVFQNKMAIL